MYSRGKRGRGVVFWVCHCLILKKKSKLLHHHKKLVVVRHMGGVWKQTWCNESFMCYRARLVPRAVSGSFSNNCAWSSSKRWNQLLALAPDSCLQHLHGCILWRCCRNHEWVIDFAKLACKSPRLNWAAVNLTPDEGLNLTPDVGLNLTPNVGLLSLEQTLPHCAAM